MAAPVKNVGTTYVSAYISQCTKGLDASIRGGLGGTGLGGRDGAAL